MKPVALWWLFAPCLAHAVLPPAQAQESVENVLVELRVVSATIGSAIVDRGSVDGLDRGDRITFRTRDGKAFTGVVRRLEERGASVDLDDPNFVPAAGTRGEALIPASRFAPVAAPPPVLADPQASPQAAPEHEPWPQREDEWTQDQPLLARVKPLRPRERPRSVRGRIYGIGDYIYSTEDDRTDGFYRAGAELLIENAAGNGERIHFEGELNYRNTQVPDDDDETATHLRIDRASYAVGGHRFQPNRLELGRFLHDNLPEFGLTDGVEWSRRLDGGDRFGFSAGFMPEPDPELSSIQDFQLSTSYRWVFDAREQLSAAAGYQKTLHDADADRDLFVGKFQFLPSNGWTFTSTAWVDYYTEGDAIKSAGFGLTQAYVNAGKRWSDGSSANLVYSHLAYVDMQRYEFLPPTAAQIADDRYDRLALQARVAASGDVRLHGSIAAWDDQDDNGSDGSAGVELEGAIFQRSVIDITGFVTEGKFVSVVGGRASFAFPLDDGRWGFEYELANNRIDGFTDDNDDLPQHRLRVFTDFFTSGGWNLSFHLDAFAWDQENSLNLGFYIQRSF